MDLLPFPWAQQYYQMALTRLVLNAFFGTFALCIQFRSPKPLYQSTTKSESNVIILRVNVKKKAKKLQNVFTFCHLGSHFAALTCALPF